MLATFVLLAGLLSIGLGVNSQAITAPLVVLTADNGIITSPENVTDITYEIRAPAGKKIELTFELFTFVPCQLNEQACHKNHHLIISNQQGAIDPEFYSQITRNNKTNRNWIFCDSFRPFRKFISISNELTLANHMLNKNINAAQTVAYEIKYRFLDTEFTTNGQIRVVQDTGKLSPIGGYLHTVRVPAGHHLRLSGKSTKCRMPEYTVLSKHSVDRLFTRINKVLTLSPRQFIEANCTYLFDISEPKLVDKLDWHAEWFLQINSPADLYDFEITWRFVKNQLIDAIKPGRVELPAQNGFNLTEELEFLFLTRSTDKKYTINLVTVNNNDTSAASPGWDQQSYIRSKVFGLQELRIPLMSHVSSKSEHSLQKFNGTLFIKRNRGWSMLIEYELAANSGDCDFDSSLCGYDVGRSGEVRHVPKYAVFNSYADSMENEDFYLSFNDTVYTPTIRVQTNLQTTERSHGSINNKPISLSFSYLSLEDNDVGLNLLIDSIRSDVRETLSSRSAFRTLVSRGVVGGEIVEMSTANKHCDGVNGVWRRVENMPVFSCFDFKLGFETNLTIGLDDVVVNYRNDPLTKCDEIQTCSNNGECYTFNGQSTCCCFPGFTGDDCSQEQTACDSIICHNNSTCSNLPGFDYQCQCQTGFTGVHCETEIDECLTQPCGLNGICHDKIGTYSCACQPGFSGRNCEETSQFCKITCSAEGTLKCYEAGATSVKCQCKPGFTGDICDQAIDECASNPCANGAKCIDRIDQFECVCPEGKTGKFCQEDIDYCIQHGHFCQMNSTCLEANITTVIMCSCPFGFTGRLCDEVVASTSCEVNPCQNGGVCIEQEIGYRCDCPKGKVGVNCEATPANPCFGNKCVNGHCVAIEEDYVCKCYDNYAGDFCDKQECSAENMASFCEVNSTLEVVRDISFHDKLVCSCVCKNGYSGDRCEEKFDMCDVMSHALSEYRHSRGVETTHTSYCANGGVCSFNEDLNEIECQCAEGFTGDRCEILLNNACKQSPCKYGRCISLDGENYECKCSNGWTGTNCDEQVKCLVDVECVANNTIAAKYSFADDRCICQCKHGFEGNDCGVNHDDCGDLKPEFRCQNGGKCVDKVGTYDCECPKGFGGIFCEQKLKGCAMNPCKFGKCEEDNFSVFKCTCATGYTGDLCDTPADPCSSNPCHNNAICHNLIPTRNSSQYDFFCECPPEFGANSKTCEHRTIDPCFISPCLNNATCSSTSQFIKVNDVKTLIFTDFKCKCPPGYFGNLCQEKTTSCAADPCQNRGRCTPSRVDDSFTCSCYPAFTGKFCEHLFDQCASFPCSNGATCMSTPKGPKCQCPVNFSGPNCDVPARPCDSMKCLNGGKCAVGMGNVPFCECANRRFTGTQCEIDLRELMNGTRSVRSERVLENEEETMSVSCGVLGNDADTIDYVFVALVIAGVLILVLVVAYIYVQVKVKRIKMYLRNVNFDNEITTEIYQVTNTNRKSANN